MTLLAVLAPVTHQSIVLALTAIVAYSIQTAIPPAAQVLEAPASNRYCFGNYLDPTREVIRAAVAAITALAVLYRRARHAGGSARPR